MEDKAARGDKISIAQPFVLPEVSLADLGNAVDAVVAWVDGADPEHAEKRARYLDQKVASHAKSGHRFRDTDEIRYCLRSIRNHAPWIRKIWLLTDDQFPASIDREFAEREGVHVIDHRAIFAGYEDYLPTFNSLAIETFMWRIPDLSDRFLYFNDDMLLTAPVKRKHFFADDKVILRGKWKNAEAIDPIPWNIENQIVSARLTGFDPAHFWASAHVAHAMYRPVLEALYHANRGAFEENARQRFRKKTQWWSVSIHDNWLLKNGYAKEKSASDAVHFSVGFCRNGDRAIAQARLARVASHEARLMCVNDMAALTDKVPDALDYIATATGPARSFEAIPREVLEAEFSRLQTALANAKQKQQALCEDLERARSGLVSPDMQWRKERAENEAVELEKVIAGLASEIGKIRARPFRHALSRVYRRIQTG